MPALYRCLEHDTVQEIGTTCAGVAKGSCHLCGHWLGQHYATRTFAGDAVTGCSGETSGGYRGEYNVPCPCAGFEGDTTASVTVCRHER